MMGGIDDSEGKEPGDQAESTAALARRVFHSSLAGTWYSADEGGLVRELEACFSRVPQHDLPSMCALILPHAGYQWSGTTAAHGAKALAVGRWDRVVVLGPSHRVRMENQASVPDETHYATPLGELPLDQHFIARLKEHPQFATFPTAQQGEHSVQIEIPLLQHVLGHFQLVPIVVGQLNLETAREMAAVLRGLIDSRTLVVASSDFTHYGGRFGYVPFGEPVAENIERLDMGAFEHIRAKDAGGFLGYIAQTGATICGRHSIAILLAMLPDEAEAHLLQYDTSGRIGGDFSNSVSYMAVGFTGQWGQQLAPTLEQERTLSQEDRASLLRLARESLLYAVRHGRAPTAGELGIRPSHALQAVAASFVTWRKQGQLRGCVGEIYPTRPLYQSVINQAVNAGLNDRRFTPVAEAELDDVSVEISVLTMPRPIRSIGEITLGTHGIVVRKNGRAAVFLPKVASEHGWDLQETLQHLAYKAGLSKDAWRDGMAFEVFEADVYGDEDRKG